MLSDDTRASIGIARFFLSLIAGAFVVWIVQAVTSPLSEHAGDVGTDPAATQGTEWLNIAISNLPLVFLGIAFFGLIALSVFEREMLRG